MTQEHKLPKNTLFTTWSKAHGSIGDLGPGYPIDYFAGTPTKFAKTLTKLGISGLAISDFDRYLSKNKIKIRIGSVILLFCAIGYRLYS